MQKILKNNQESYNDLNLQCSNLVRSESKALTSEREHEFNRVINILFETTDKCSSNLKRRFEHQVKFLMN